MSTDAGPDRLAVYGTLVPGGRHAAELDAAGGTWTRGHVRGVRHDPGWQVYPGLVLDPAGDRVPVHVLTSPALARAWDRLDAFEGPGYRRVVTDVELRAGRVVPAFVYVLSGPPAAG